MWDSMARYPCAGGKAFVDEVVVKGTKIAVRNKMAADMSAQSSSLGHGGQVRLQTDCDLCHCVLLAV